MHSRETPRLRLRAIDEAEATRILDREPSEQDRWADGYPFEGDLAAMSSFLRASAQHGEQGPFGPYQIVRKSDGSAVGGMGFKGPPVDGTVEIGYGLIPGARGRGYAAEALVALLAIAGDQGVSRVRADTTNDNIASQRTLQRTGFEQVTADGTLRRYEIQKEASPAAPTEGSPHA